MEAMHPNGSITVRDILNYRLTRLHPILRALEWSETVLTFELFPEPIPRCRISFEHLIGTRAGECYR